RRFSARHTIVQVAAGSVITTAYGIAMRFTVMGPALPSRIRRAATAILAPMERELPSAAAFFPSKFPPSHGGPERLLCKPAVKVGCSAKPLAVLMACLKI